MIVHLNGNLVRREDAAISPLDRGFIFGDGVYEGLRSVPSREGAGKRIIGLQRHVERMRVALDAAKIEWDPARIDRIAIELLEANGLTDAFVYCQVTRGTPLLSEPARSRVPSRGMTPTVFAYCTPQPALESFKVGGPPRKSAIVCEDKRWLLGHLKCTSLMGNVMASMEADAAGAEDAIFVRDGVLAEGLATNVIVVDAAGNMATPSLESASMLAGVTRAILLNEVPELGERVVEAAELAAAREVILTGTTTMVTSVVKLDGRTVGDGTPGPVAKRLLRVLVDAIQEGKDAACYRTSPVHGVRPVHG